MIRHRHSPPRAAPRRTRERKLKEYLSTPLLCLRAKSFACGCAALYLAGAPCAQRRRARSGCQAYLRLVQLH